MTEFVFGLMLGTALGCLTRGAPPLFPTRAPAPSLDNRAIVVAYRGRQ